MEKNFENFFDTEKIFFQNTFLKFFFKLFGLKELFAKVSTAVFVEGSSGSYFYKKKTFFFLRPLIRSKATREKISASVLRTVPTSLTNGSWLRKQTSNLH